MPTVSHPVALLRTFLANPHLIRVDPAVNRFMTRYMGKFRVTNLGGKLIIHSHLPALNSKPYSRFVREHLINRTDSPSHAQIAVTNACPQNCTYCYNRDRTGRGMDSGTIKDLIGELQEMGVVWLGFTGGEPLTKKDLPDLIACAADGCAVKLFTNGCGLTRQMAEELRDAGLFSVSVSLDHWDEATHDRGRGFPGAYRSALEAIAIFGSLRDLHVSVSAVLTRDMIRNEQVECFLGFLRGLNVHEAWLSEVKPSVEPFWDSELVITEEERLNVVEIQDRWNRANTMTVNYLGHSEGREHFGCNAGHKMVYVDAFGEVSPCVFTPFSFGNVHEKPLPTLFAEMKSWFPSEESCFMNRNYPLVQRHSGGHLPMRPEQTLAMMNEVELGPLAAFYEVFYRHTTGRKTAAI